MNAGFSSAELLRSGLDTLATDFWLACVAPGGGDLNFRLDITSIVPALPLRAREML
jgi:hypothetical protein